MFDFQAKQPSTSLSTDQLRACLEKVEMALLLEPSINSAIVRLTQDQVVAYFVVSSRLLDITEIHKHLQNFIPLEWIPQVFIPLVALPFNSYGQLDELTLSNIPAIDQHLAAKWEDLISQQPDIEKVAVVVSDRPKQDLPLHLSDLLPNWVNSQSVHTSDRIEQIVNSSDNSQEIKSDRLAIRHGEHLRIEANAPLTLIDSLKQAARNSPELGVVYIALDGTETKQTYPELLAVAQSVMAGLRQLGLQPQDKVIFQLKNNSDFLVAFWGCILGGFVPVPLSVATSYQELNNNVKKLHYTWELLDRPIILTDRHLLADIQSVANLLNMSDLQIAEIESLRQSIPDLECHDSQPEDLAILLLTSGSTGNPKAVMQTHQSIMMRSLATIQMNQFTDQDISLNWMPLDHVGGIVMFHIRDICLACQQIHIATEFILGEPLRWLDLIARFRATITWAPNFAYGLINNHLESNLPKKWDLSSMRFVLNGGEAVVPKVARLFLQRLQGYGLSKTAMHPAWGMSETCSGVIYSDMFSLDSTSDLDAFVEVGAPVPEFSVRIVDQKGNLVHEETIGIVQVQGSMVTKGYYGNLEANQEAFTADGWFNTGDLGMLHAGRLTITGRQKDTIIINGSNYYSHEIEGVVEEIKGIAISFTAAVGVRDGGDTDRLVIFFSPIAQDEMAIVKLSQTIRERVLQSSGIYPDHVIPVTTTIPKTAIGKIQRSQLKQQFEAGEFNHIIKKFDILAANSNTIPDWFFRKAWYRQEHRSYAISPSNRSVLIFLDRLGLGEALAQTLISEGQTCIKVEIGSEFTKFSSHYYAIAPNNANHYYQLLGSLIKDSFTLTDILHLWTYDESSGEIASVEELELAQEYGLYSLLFLVQALVKTTNQSPIKLKLQVVSSNAQAVLDQEAITYEKTTLLGITKAIPAEIPWLNCQHLDLSHLGDTLSDHTALILQEFSILSKEPEVSYRNGQRFVSRLTRVDFSQSPKQEIPFKQGGTYLLTGGLGGIGLELAKYLIKEYQARLLIVGRTPLPPRSSWEEHLQQSNHIAAKILAYQTLEQIDHHNRDRNIIYQAVDITNLDTLKFTITQAQEQWQSDLDGVIHLAGLYHEAALVDETPSAIAKILSPKMAGTWVLNQLLKDKPNSIFISFSSIIGFFSGANLGAYAAANSFLEGFNDYQRKQNRSSYCFAWSMWDELGMSQGYTMKELIRTKGRYTLTPQQGIQSFISCLHHGQAKTMIGLEPTNPFIRKYLEEEPYNLYGLIAFWQRSRQVSIQETASMISDRLNSLALGDVFNAPSKCRFIQVDQIPLTITGEIDRQKLLDLDKSFNGDRAERVSPRNAAERQIAKIWQDVLKLEQISINDNFFELGGQSLLATQVTSRIREVFRLNLELSDFFRAPTIAEIINSLTSQAPSPEYIDKVAELREKISTMSPKEIQARLYKDKSPTN